MRQHEARHQRERPPGLAGIAHQAAAGRKTHLLVIFDLEGRHRASGLEHRIHVVIPAVDPLAGIVPVRHPGEIGRIDVGRDPLLEAVKLVRADEMHASGKAGPVTGAAQVMRECRHRGCEIRRIVVGAVAADKLAGHQAGARRRAQRRVAVGGVEPHAAGGKRVEIRRFHDRMAVGAGELRRQLVGHDQYDVGLGRSG